MRVEVIVDIGCNHNGSLRLAKRMIKRAANIECDYVKFQYYSTDEIIEFEKQNPPSLYTKEMFDRIREYEFNIDQMIELKEHCDREKIEFLCTPFLKPERIDDLNPLVKRWKIRERDGRNPQYNSILQRALETRKEVFVSTTKLPIKEHLLFNPRLKWLFTIPKYPAPLDRLDLARVSNYDGYSNHIPTLVAPLATVISAKVKGKERWILEVHVTQKRGMIDKTLGRTVIDETVSFSFEEVATLISQIKEIQQCRATTELF